MNNDRILAIDDDPIVLSILCASLEDAGFDVIKASNGKQGMEILEAATDQFDAVILDWIMPEMDGIAVLKLIKADTRFIGLPIIMQTSLSEPQYMEEAIKAGVYYYITKPYDDTTLIKVVRAAVAKFHQFREGMSWGIEATAGLALLRRGEFAIRNLSEAHMVANLLADLAERPAPVISGLLELITNAIEDGNLGVNYRDKANFIAERRWDEELRRRLYLPENQHKVVTVSFVVSEEHVTVEIKDQGAGFDWQPYLELQENRTFDTHGRGIAMARAFSFESLDYRDGGTRACVTFATS